VEPATPSSAIRTFVFVQGGYSNLDALTGSAGIVGTLCGTFAARVVDGGAIDHTDVLEFSAQFVAGPTTLRAKARPRAFRFTPGVDTSLALVAEFSVGGSIRVGSGVLPSPSCVTGWLGRFGGWTSAQIRTMELGERSESLAA
jgi:hypothetical protein